MPQTMRPANAGLCPALRILGADVAKTTVVFHDSHTGQSWSTANTAQALHQALASFTGCDWLVCETTGGYERPLLDACLALGLAACRVDAARVKAFIVSHGGRAKTDRIDAAWLARYGLERAHTLTAWRTPDPRHQAFADLVSHRQDLVAQRTRARNRRGAPGAEPLHRLLDRQIAFLTGQLAEIDADIAALIKASPALAHDEQALRAIPGIGPVAARTLIALLPELGRLGPKQAASLAGLAPHPHDSGTASRRRRMTGGRTGLKPILFMAALSAAKAHPALNTLYKRLVHAGKPKRLAIAALARKLVVIANAVLRDTRKTNQQLT